MYARGKFSTGDTCHDLVMMLIATNLGSRQGDIDDTRLDLVLTLYATNLVSQKKGHNPRSVCTISHVLQCHNLPRAAQSPT